MLIHVYPRWDSLMTPEQKPIVLLYEQVKDEVGTRPVIACALNTRRLMGNDHKVNMEMDYVTVQTHRSTFVFSFFQRYSSCSPFNAERLRLFSPRVEFVPYEGIFVIMFDRL